MNVSTILTELAQALTSTGINVYASPVDAGQMPAIEVRPPSEIRYAERYSGACEIDVPLRLYVANSDLSTTWALVYKLISTDSGSVWAAVKAASPTNYRIANLTTASAPVAITNEGGQVTGVSVDLNLTIYTN